jgi:chromosome segregation ATPase
MGLFKRRADDSEQIQELKSQIASMAERLGRADAAKRQLDERVEGIASRLETPPPPEAPPEPPPTVHPDELDILRARIERIAVRIDEVDQRLSSMGTELANQISELSGDLESLGAGEPPAEHVLDELRDAQTRLANEQARYQIAFRQDLADLADRLRKT